MSVTTLLTAHRTLVHRQPGWIVAAVRLQAVPDRDVPDARDRAAGGVPHLSARPRHLARLHRHHHRPARRRSSASRISSICWTDPLWWSAVFYSVFYTAIATVRKIRARLLAGAAAQQPLPVQEPAARHHAAALDRADGAVGAGVLVDLRSAVLDHLLSAGRRAAHPHHQYRLPRHALAGAVLADRGQHLARHSRSSRSRCWRACRPSRPRSTRRRCWTAPAPGSASATSPSR